MKDKGFILLLIVGIGFMFFVFNVVGKVEGDDVRTLNPIDDSAGYGDSRSQEILRHYKQDVTGTSILDLSNVPLDKAKKIWSASPTKDRIVKLFPNFNLMKDMIKLRVAPSEFRDYLLQKVNDVEEQYLAGNIDEFHAKKAIANLE